MTSRHAILGLLLAGAVAPQAWGQSFVEVTAGRHGFSVEDNSGNHPELAGVPRVAGRAKADLEEQTATISTQPLNCPAACFVSGPGTGTAIARAEANGTAGVLRGGSTVIGSGEFLPLEDISYASSLARLTDTITFGGSAIIEVDLDYVTSLAGQGDTGLTFQVGTMSTCSDFDPDCIPEPILLADYTFYTYDPPDGPREEFYSFEMFTPTGYTAETGDFVPSGFGFALDLSPFVGLPLPLFFELSTYATIYDEQQAFTRAENSGYIKIENAVSANGYNYAGRPAAVDPVPEPATWVMLLLGFGAIGVMVRRRSRRTV